MSYPSLTWQDSAACHTTDPEAFFPPPGAYPHTAIRICSTCHVKQECLDAALAIPSSAGVWGGATEAQRKEILTSQAVAS